MTLEAAYSRTDVGEIDVKQLPERVAMQAEGEGSDGRNGLFRSNFRFLKANELAMTTPVETDVKTARMRFYVPQEDEDKQFSEVPGVRVVRMPARTVVSVGMRGSYQERRFARGERALRAWLDDHPEWREAGEAYGVYWNGPMVPGPFRRMEVHIPVVRAE